VGSLNGICLGGTNPGLTCGANSTSASQVANANPGDSLKGDFIQAFGTFAAAPVVASILSIINNARIMVGKKPIGFINPTISLVFFV
jgi:tripeptidyl-peptidase I